MWSAHYPRLVSILRGEGDAGSSVSGFGSAFWLGLASFAQRLQYHRSSGFDLWN